jgi:hypothetical protein
VDVLITTAEGDFRLHDGAVAPFDGEQVGSSATVARVDGNCFAPFDGQTLVGTDEAHVFLVDAHGHSSLVESFDEIPGRDHWYTPWGAPAATRSLTVTADGVPLVNVHVGGVWRGDQKLRSWTEVVPVDDDTHQVLAAEAGPLVVVAAAVGFGWSVDDGQTYRWTTDGLHASYCRAVAVAGDHALVSASTGPFTKQSAVYRRLVDSTEPFERCRSGLPEWFDFNIDTFQLSASDGSVAIGTEDGDVFLSEDAGSTWSLAAKDLPAIRSVTLA